MHPSSSPTATREFAVNVNREVLLRVVIVAYYYSLLRRTEDCHNSVDLGADYKSLRIVPESLVRLVTQLQIFMNANVLWTISYSDIVCEDTIPLMLRESMLPLEPSSFDLRIGRGYVVGMGVR
jgi:hypothetical protein